MMKRLIYLLVCSLAHVRAQLLGPGPVPPVAQSPAVTGGPVQNTGS